MADIQRWQAKVIAIFVVLVTVIISALLPIGIWRHLDNKQRIGYVILGCFICFSGGIFLGSYLLHVSVEALHLLNENLLKKYNIEYPVTQVIIGTTFFAVLVLEKLILMLYEKRMVRDSKHTNDQMPVHVNGAYEAETEQPKSAQIDDINISEEKVMHMDETKLDYQNTTPNGQGAVENLNQPLPEEIKSKHEHTSMSAILLLAMSVDSLFEGLALGFKTTTSSVWTLMIPICFHEMAMSFCFSLQLMRAGFSVKKVVGVSGCYALLASGAIALGTGIYESQADSVSSETLNIVSGFFQAIAAGSFLYVTFYEILLKELSHESPWKKIISAMLGFALMAGISAIPHGHDDEHDHDHDHDHDHNGTTPSVLW